MWLEIFKFEIKYRLKRPETYIFFVFLFLFSIVGVDFVFQGIEIGAMKKNAPIIIGKTMGALTGIFMILTSMIMGVPVLRDYQYETEALLFINPITKRDYLLGRFLGSFLILSIIFSGLPLGMILGEQMPWHKTEEILAFNLASYLNSFAYVVLPTLFFGAAVFFVTGMLSKKLLVVYTQGIVLFVVFLLTKAITNEYLQGLLDPFSLTTLTQYTKDWSVDALNANGISMTGILLHNKLIWFTLGIVALVIGYRKFSFSSLAKKPKRKTISSRDTQKNERNDYNLTLPKVKINHGFRTQCVQLYELTKFYTLSLLKETSFWAIAICGIIIIVINSVNLGTVYSVDSYPATYFIIAELQEMSMFFFIIILLFYSGELIWMERQNKQYVINDATPISNIVTLSGKFIALTVIYMVLMLSLILTGIIFQIANGYYHFQLDVYFTGLFIEILPFLVLYTFIAFFFQTISKNKFIGIFLSLVFFIINVGSEFFGFNHSLYKFGGKPLGIYSEMNGYGHFLQPYLWIKAYWLTFGIILLLFSAIIMNRGKETKLIHRIKGVKEHLTKPLLYSGLSLIVAFMVIGSFIFYNTNHLNTYWTETQEQQFRAGYETSLKPLEYLPQPKITNANLNIELYPEKRGYEFKGTYTLKNTTNNPIDEIHVQKFIASHVILDEVNFDREVDINKEFKTYEYTIYKLASPLEAGTSMTMSFKQSYVPHGFEDDNSGTEIVYNGTFFNNTMFPTFGYNRNYELRDADQRIAYDLPVRLTKAEIDDPKELVNARSGSDSDGVNLKITVGTSQSQRAIAPGVLQKEWEQNNRNYFYYETQQPIINYYSIVSADYEVETDSWKPSELSSEPVDLEIYYHEGHDYNLDRMMASMKASLSYYSENFTPYQYQQLRIMEFPRYAEFAQSLPNTIPFSEALGFVLDIDDEEDVDMAFYITAHEIAHQWFGMQIEAANVQGRNFVLETLAQYGAIMVLNDNFPIEKVEQFLDLQKEIYEKKRKKTISEPSLALVENQDFVYYYKGVIAMYNLQQLIGEEQVNKAIKRFIEDWDSYKGSLKIATGQYPTSADLLGYFRDVTPVDQQAIIHDLFETNEDLEILK